MKLKIKDDVDLKELEKFGFIHKDETEKSVEYYEYEKNDENNFEVCRVTVYNRKLFCIEALYKVYDLIKADVVEKVEG